MVSQDSMLAASRPSASACASQEALAYGGTQPTLLRPGSIPAARGRGYRTNPISGLLSPDAQIPKDGRKTEDGVVFGRSLHGKVSEPVAPFGSLDAPSYFRSANAEGKWINDMLNWTEGRRRIRSRRPVADDRLASMPQDDRARTAEAIRRIAPDLLALNRYECHAVFRRDRAIRALTQRRSQA
jgi:hypothetical protein